MARWTRTTILAALGLGLLWLSIASAVSLVLGRELSTLALRIRPTSAQAQAVTALSIATAQPVASAARMADASRLARTAVRREGGNVSAVAALGTLASLRGRNDVSDRIFAYSERLSRRDVLTQMWLIQNRVDHADVAGALIHYDRLMRVTPALRPTLIPVLVQATRDPAIARDLARVLAHRPNWWLEVLTALIVQSPAPAVTLPILLQPMHLRADRDQERPLLAATMSRLADAGAFGQAFSLYLRSGGTRGTATGNVRAADFAKVGRLPPFDWDLHNEEGRAAVIQPSRNGSALFLYMDADHQGEVARQLLLLSPGRYRLAVRSGNITGDDYQRPQVGISCAPSRATPLATLRLPSSGDAGRIVETDFAVATGCPAQWLSIRAGGTDTQDNPSRIDAISIRPIR